MRDLKELEEDVLFMGILCQTKLLLLAFGFMAAGAFTSAFTIFHHWRALVDTSPEQLAHSEFIKSVRRQGGSSIAFWSRYPASDGMGDSSLAFIGALRHLNYHKVSTLVEPAQHLRTFCLICSHSDPAIKNKKIKILKA